MKREKQENQTCRPNLVYDQIGASIYEELCDSKLHVSSIISSKENVLRCVRAEIKRFAGPESFEVTLYGSVSMYLCEEESDLDVCLSTLKNAWLRFPSEGEFVPFSFVSRRTRTETSRWRSSFPCSNCFHCIILYLQAPAFRYLSFSHRLPPCRL